MLSGVLGVKESISDDILSILFHLSHYSEQEAQMDQYCSLKEQINNLRLLLPPFRNISAYVL